VLSLLYAHSLTLLNSRVLRVFFFYDVIGWVFFCCTLCFGEECLPHTTSLTKVLMLGRTKRDGLSIRQKYGAHRAPLCFVPQYRGCVLGMPGVVGAPSGYAQSGRVRGGPGAQEGAASSRCHQPSSSRLGCKHGPRGRSDDASPRASRSGHEPAWRCPPHGKRGWHGSGMA